MRQCSCTWVRRTSSSPNLRRTKSKRRLRQAERDQGRRPGLTTDERQQLKDLQRENFELKRANEILKKASAYFAQAELDRRAR